VERKRRPEPGVSICGLSLSAQQLIFLLQREEKRREKAERSRDKEG
jgi:hypothetical protein